MRVLYWNVRVRWPGYRIAIRLDKGEWRYYHANSSWLSFNAQGRMSKIGAP